MIWLLVPLIVGWTEVGHFLVASAGAVLQCADVTESSCDMVYIEVRHVMNPSS